MKFYTTSNKKTIKLEKDKLNSLDKAILEGCEEGLNIVRILKCGKPYIGGLGSKKFATTDVILASIDKLLKLKILERR